MKKNSRHLLVATVIFGAALAINYWQHPTQPNVVTTLTSSSTPPSNLTTTTPKTSGCMTSNGLPDSACTPGSTNPDITSSTILATICNHAWSTKSIRPPVSYTNKLKLEQMKAYGLPGTPADYEEDHLVSLEIGGNPTDPRNLWPEPRKKIIALNESAEGKDKVENYLHQQVCNGSLTLEEAQQKISVNWEQVYNTLP